MIAAHEIAQRITALPDTQQEIAIEAFRSLYGAKLGKGRRRPTILEAVKDRALFGALPAFADLKSWEAWLTFLGALYGLPLTKAQQALFCHHTGRTRYAPPKGGYREAAVITGVQSGKSRIAAVIAAYEGLVSDAEPDGTKLYSLVLAQDQRGATRTMFGYASAPFEAVPSLKRRVFHTTANTLELDSGAVIAAYPCRPASIRGIRALALVLDEFAFYIGSEEGATDLEMLRAARGRVATTGGRLVIISSPYAESGALWELDRAHYGRDSSPVLIWKATAPEMNPTLPADYLARMAETDPEAYRSEVLGEFRRGVSALFDPKALDACVANRIKERRLESGRSYFAFVDPSGGKVDAFTLAIGHREDNRAVIDLLRFWPAPFNPSGVAGEIADVLRDYGVSEVEGDNYGGEWPAEAFRSQGVAYVRCDVPKTDLYLTLLSAVNSKSVELLDQPEVLRELRGLERHRGASGRDRVDHRPGAHDDMANAAAGVTRMLLLRGPISADIAPWSLEKKSFGRVKYDPGVSADDERSALARHVGDGVMEGGEDDDA